MKLFRKLKFIAFGLSCASCSNPSVQNSIGDEFSLDKGPRGCEILTREPATFPGWEEKRPSEWYSIIAKCDVDYFLWLAKVSGHRKLRISDSVKVGPLNENESLIFDYFHCYPNLRMKNWPSFATPQKFVLAKTLDIKKGQEFKPIKLWDAEISALEITGKLRPRDPQDFQCF